MHGPDGQSESFIARALRLVMRPWVPGVRTSMFRRPSQACTTGVRSSGHGSAWHYILPQLAAAAESIDSLSVLRWAITRASMCGYVVQCISGDSEIRNEASARLMQVCRHGFC